MLMVYKKLSALALSLHFIDKSEEYLERIDEIQSLLQQDSPDITEEERKE